MWQLRGWKICFFIDMSLAAKGIVMRGRCCSVGSIAWYLDMYSIETHAPIRLQIDFEKSTGSSATVDLDLTSWKNDPSPLTENDLGARYRS